MISLILVLIGRDGGLKTLCHNCGLSCQQRLLKAFPDPGFLRAENGVVWLWYLLVNLYINISSMSYNNSNAQNAQINGCRKFIWLSPPYGQNVKTNIGKLFIKLVRKHFPKNNKYHNTFNLNTFNISYCCTSNVGNIIKKSSSKFLGRKNDSNRKCSCRLKPNCSLNSECLTKCLVYKATSTTSNIYNIPLCLLWNFWRGVENTV